jgi:hypothetical protein
MDKSFKTVVANATVDFLAVVLSVGIPWSVFAFFGRWGWLAVGAVLLFWVLLCLETVE